MIAGIDSQAIARPSTTHSLMEFSSKHNNSPSCQIRHSTISLLMRKSNRTSEDMESTMGGTNLQTVEEDEGKSEQKKNSISAIKDLKNEVCLLVELV